MSSVGAHVGCVALDGLAQSRQDQQQVQRVQDQQHEQEETEQPEETMSTFAKDLTKAIDAARVEEEFQISRWGLVEGQHDYDRLNYIVQLHAAVLLRDSISNRERVARAPTSDINRENTKQ
jgi:hypothetical protein